LKIDDVGLITAVNNASSNGRGIIHCRSGQGLKDLKLSQTGVFFVSGKFKF